MSLCSLALICSKTLFMCFFASDNNRMPSLLTSRECLYRLVNYHQINHPFAFCGGRTPQLTLQCINIGAKFSSLKTHPPESTMFYNALRESMPSITPKLQKPSFKNFYMDNYLDSVKSLEKAINIWKELVHLLYLGGFKFTKLVSNLSNLADRIDGSSQSTEPKVIVSSQEDS